MKAILNKVTNIKSIPVKKLVIWLVLAIALILGTMYFLGQGGTTPLKKIDIQRPIITPQSAEQDDEKKGSGLQAAGQSPGITVTPVTGEVQTNEAQNPVGKPSAAPQTEAGTPVAYCKDSVQIMQTLSLMSQSLADLHAKVDGLDKSIKELKDQSARQKTLERVTPKNKAGIAIPSNKGAFDIVGVDSKSVAIVANKQSKIIATGEELPNGAIFQGFDGKNVLTSKGPIRVDGAIAGQ